MILIRHYYRCKKPKWPYFYHHDKRSVVRIPQDAEEAREWLKSDPLAQRGLRNLLYLFLAFLTIIIVSITLVAC